ncbi:MAG: HAD family hydrolase [Nitriliruptorales bacterium]|nr:HAD family hydrolase [Nitriliruptorales bacterium]
MWSGPRNISTALMRSWGNREDAVVVDEPFYAYYLSHTGLAHPGREEVIASQPTRWEQVIEGLLAPLPDGATVLYQKHMAHHLLPEIGRGWLDRMSHAFLIRDPREMLTSLARVLPEPTLDDTGLEQQVEIFEASTGAVPPPVIDARDVLTAPAAVLRALCARLRVPFTRRMLSWPPGLRDTDGVWARWWYDAVAQSTGFAAYRPPGEPFPQRLEPLLEQCLPYYERLHRERIVI